MRVLDARFAGTAVDAKGAPAAGPPEVAWVGRSNVGKSSMINALVGRRKLVRVSHTPGRTRTLNFFDVLLEVEGARRPVRFVDLPGYGFAKVSKDERAKWKEMVTKYLANRSALRAVVSILDAEVGPTPDDKQALDYLEAVAPRILVVATKVDRLSKSRRHPRLLEIAGQLGVPGGAVLPFSAHEGIGLEAVWDSLLDVLFPSS